MERRIITTEATEEDVRIETTLRPSASVITWARKRSNPP